jgi:uncharacterized membrane protein YkvA (DUF1232 family)
MENANPYETPPAAAAPPATSMAGNFLSVIGLVLAGIYLANPTAGFDFIPDVIPGIGNIDEVVATTIFLACLSRLGINILPQHLPKSSPRNTVVQSHVVKD